MVCYSFTDSSSSRAHALIDIPPIARVRERIRAARVERGLSMEAASELADISPELWRYYETGIKRIDPKFGRVCNAVGLDPMELLSEEGYWR